MSTSLRRGSGIAPALAVLLLSTALPGAVPRAAAAEGTVTGTITAKVPKNREGVLVYLTGVPGRFAAPREHPVMDQKNLMFVPTILPVLSGTTVDFLNSDAVRHNVFSPDGEKFNLGTWPKGTTRPHTFAKPGVYTLLCNVHSEMQGFIVVLDNPCYAMSGKDGSFRIAHVPPGTFTLHAFTGELKARPVPVTVPAAGNATAVLTLSR